MSTASEPEPAAEEFASCAVCGRTILRGEHLHDYVDAEGEPAGVCTLCKSHAEASGWIPAALAGTVSRHAGGRRPRGLRLRERLARRGTPESAEPSSPAPAPARAASSEPLRDETGHSAEPQGRSGEPEGPPGEPEGPPGEPEGPPGEPEGPPGEPEPVPEPEPPTPLETFNASEKPRTIAGLMRSLGAPRATIRSTADGELVTVAWELSWYQWRVSDGQVSEVAKGGELSELAAADREWNASPADDGQLVLD